MNTMIPVENGDVLAGMQSFLQRLMQSGVVEAIYVPMRVDGGAILPALVADPSWLKQADPLTPVMPINGARAVSALTNKHTPARLGAVLRPGRGFRFRPAALPLRFPRRKKSRYSGGRCSSRPVSAR